MSSSTLRIVLTVVISLGILLVWNYFFSPKKPQTRRRNQVGQKAKGGQAKGGPAKRPKVGAGTASKSGASASTQPSSQPAKTGKTAVPAVNISPEGKQTTLDWRAANATITFTNTQAALRHVILKNKRYKELRAGKLRQIDLVQTLPGKGPWPLEAAFPDSDFRVPKNVRYKLVRRSKSELTYAWSSKQVRIQKHYLLDKTRPVLWMSVEVTNLGKRMLDERLKMKLFARQDPHKAAPGMTNPYPRIPTGLCHVNGKRVRRSAGSINGKQSSCSAAGCGMGSGAFSQVGQVNWIASDDRYFLTALVPRDAGAQRRCEIKLLPSDPEVVEASLLFSQVKIKPGGTQTHKFMVYLGPKVLKQLDGVRNDAKKDLELSDSIEFGWFAVLCRPMLAVLEFFYLFVGNWGLAIILLTLVVKALTFWPTHKSMKSMRSMQRLKPHMDALKEKYGADKQRLNQEMMNLYKVHKVNPLGGCLPMLIQMPIWFALYRTLGNAQELYRSGFFGWITDLTAPDPYYILPIAMGISMFAQQAITPQPMEGTQAKIMKYFMPGMFTFMMLWLPAGLTLYIFVNTLLTMIHQWHMNRSDPLPTKEQAAKDAAAALKSNDPPPRPSKQERPGVRGGSGGQEGRASGGRSRKKRRRRKRPPS